VENPVIGAENSQKTINSSGRWIRGGDTRGGVGAWGLARRRSRWLRFENAGHLSLRLIRLPFPEDIRPGGSPSCKAIGMAASFD